MEFLIGICQLQLKDLDFDAYRSRGKNKAAVEYLEPVLVNSCESHLWPNQIPVRVSPNELHDMLAVSQVSLEDLARTQSDLLELSLLSPEDMAEAQAPEYPRLKTAHRVECIHGRQRYEAAIGVFGPEEWWTIRIYCLPEGSDPYLLLPHETDHFCYQTPYSDGDVYRNAHMYADKIRKEKFLRRLTKYKRRGYRRLRKSGLSEKFKALATFPGVLEGLELGNLDRHFSTHATDEMARYLDRIFKVWDKITLGDPDIRAAADAETVRAVELRAPSVSIEDRQHIRDLMRSGVLFRRVSRPDLRARIESSMLQVAGVIPSIKTFHKNMKYLSIAANIIKTHILEQLGADESIYKAMSALWRRNRPGRCFLEYGEHCFHELQCRPTPKLGYQQLVVAALRLFPHLTQIHPRCEHGERRRGLARRSTGFARHDSDVAGLDSSYQASFLRKAQRWGFNSPKVEQALSTLEGARPVCVDDLGEATGREEMQLKRRCGIPFSRSYSCIKRTLFVPQLLAEQGLAAHPTTLFIQRDFIWSFFGEVTGVPELDVSIGRIPAVPTRSLDSRQPVSSSTPRAQTPGEDVSAPGPSGSPPEVRHRDDTEPSSPIIDSPSARSLPPDNSLVNISQGQEYGRPIAGAQAHPRFTEELEQERAQTTSGQTADSISTRSLIVPNLSRQLPTQSSSLGGNRGRFVGGSDDGSVPSMTFSSRSSASLSSGFREWLLNLNPSFLPRFVRSRDCTMDGEDTESYRSLIFPGDLEMGRQ